MIPSGPAPFNGIYPSTICPFQPDFSIDEAALADHAASLARVPGIVGILCNGHAGENFALSGAEKQRVARITREAIGEEAILVSGINCENSLEAAEHAREARDAGADALMVFPPNSWALSQDETMALNHHRLIGAAADLPMMLFQGSVGAGRTAYPPKVLEQLVGLPKVVGIKEGSWETTAYEANLRLVRQVAPDVAVMASGDEHLLTCYVLGSDGSLVSLAVVIPEAIVALDAAVRRGDLAAARQAHEIVYPLARQIYGAEPKGRAVARLKTCLKLLGRLEDDRVRPPHGPLDQVEVDELRRALAAANLL
jgi:4-hydroxy-tetrahydrodipicolinate synthase